MSEHALRRQDSLGFQVARRLILPMQVRLLGVLQNKFIVEFLLLGKLSIFLLYL